MSLPNSVIAALIAAGVTAEQLGAAAMAANAEAEQKVAERRQKDAARKRAKRAILSAMSAGHDGTDADSKGHDGTASDTADTPPDGPLFPPAPPNTPLNPPIPLSASAQTLLANSEFGQWWAEYPHKVGKGAALPAFLKARKQTSLADLIAGVGRYRESLAQPNAPNPCNPATWLNDQRWLDQPMSPANARQSTSSPASAKPHRGASVWNDPIVLFGEGAGAPESGDDGRERLRAEAGDLEVPYRVVGGG